jgi:hypothetical protein
MDAQAIDAYRCMSTCPLHGARSRTACSANKYFGVIDAEHQRALSGLEFVRGLVHGALPLNTMAKTRGYDIIQASKGRVVAAAKPHDGHCNPAGTVHGGLAVRPVTPETGL